MTKFSEKTEIQRTDLNEYEQIHWAGAPGFFMLARFVFWRRLVSFMVEVEITRRHHFRYMFGERRL